MYGHMCVCAHSFLHPAVGALPLVAQPVGGVQDQDLPSCCCQVIQQSIFLVLDRGKASKYD